MSGPTAQVAVSPHAFASNPQTQSKVSFSGIMSQPTWAMPVAGPVHPNLVALLYAGATAGFYGAQTPYFFPQTQMVPTMMTGLLPELPRQVAVPCGTHMSLKRQGDGDIRLSTKRPVHSEADSPTDSDSENEEGCNDLSTRSEGSDVRVKGPWTVEEDARLKELVAEYGPRWSVVAEKLPGRIGKQCRERYLNHLDDKIKRGPWTPQEDAILWEAHNARGNRWCQIAKLLPGRPENAVKNRYTSLAHKKAKADSAKSKVGSLQQYDNSSVSSAE